MTDDSSRHRPSGSPSPRRDSPAALRPVGIDLVLWACLPAAVLATLAGLALTGAAAPSVLFDPGSVVRFGLPLARVVHDTAAAATIGFALFAVCLAPGTRSAGATMSVSQWLATRWALRAACVWALAALTTLVLTAANVLGMRVSAPGFGSQLWFVATRVELGQTLAVSFVLVCLCGVTLAVARTLAAVTTANVLALAALLPIALGGHAAGSAEHGNAVNGLAVHLLGVTVWAGGLLALVVLRRSLGPALRVVVARYSTLALWSFVAVGLSGLVNAFLRLGAPSDLGSRYGALIVVKTVALGLLGVAGWWHRSRLIPHLGTSRARQVFVRLATAEVVIMAVTLGVSVALSRSAPPVSQAPISDDPRYELLGFRYPPPVSFVRMLTQVHLDWAWAALAVALAGLYVAGVVRLHRRGDAWPVGRTVSWLLGCVLLLFFTSGGPAVYGSVHFSTHMILHMGLMMFVPVPLVLGGPVLLALRALRARTDASRGPREWILVLVHSRVAAFLARPAVAGIIFAGSLVAFYFTPWFRFALFDHSGHVLMQVHFLLSGYLFFWMLVGVDPGPRRPPPPIRLIVLLATLAFHAFFGVALMSQDTLLAASWWHAMLYTDDAALLVDQHTAGGIAWGAGELPTVVVAIVVMVQWARTDARAAVRYDRKADRDGDAELAAYNERLARLAARDEGQP